MKIYENELRDGIIQLQDSTRAVSEVITCSEFPKDSITESFLKTIAKYSPSNPNQQDLHYLNCVLASVGWNRNDDVFDKAEFLKARCSPEDKPFNYMHDEDDIIGHMTGALVVDREGNQIDAECPIEEAPDALDLVVSAVIYKAWSEVENLARINQIIDDMNKGEWCVSMECLFRNFDYALISPEGESKTLTRNEETSFLTKHLRVYGGTGEYKGYKVGRVLRNIAFSGIGLVKRPANPRSIILNSENSLGEFVMADVAKTAAEQTVEVENLNTQVAELNTKLEQAVAEANAEKTKADELQIKVTQLETDLSAAKAEYDSVNTQLKAMQDKLRTMERRSVLANLKLDESLVEQMLSQFKDLDDNAFTAAVSLAKCMPKAAEVVATTETTETEVEVEDEVESVDASETVITPDTDKTQENRKAIAEYFRNNLKTTKNLKEKV